MICPFFKFQIGICFFQMVILSDYANKKLLAAGGRLAGGGSNFIGGEGAEIWNWGGGRFF